MSPELVAADTLQALIVIVVDDDRDCREMMATVLELYGARVFTAPGAKAALHILARQSADAIVTDLMMPGEDGYWLLRHARDVGGPTIPLICVTGAASGAREVLGAGFDGFLRKPVDPDELVKLVTESLRARPGREPSSGMVPAPVDRTASLRADQSSMEVDRVRGR